jgi:hypothetical protein
MLCAVELQALGGIFFILIGTKNIPENLAPESHLRARSTSSRASGTGSPGVT